MKAQDGAEPGVSSAGLVALEVFSGLVVAVVVAIPIEPSTAFSRFGVGDHRFFDEDGENAGNTDVYVAVCLLVSAHVIHLLPFLVLESELRLARPLEAHQSPQL